MIDYGVPIVVAIFVWWASTGAILYLDGLPRATFKWSLSAITVAGLCALAAAARTSGDATVTGAVVGFVCGVTVWAVPTAGFFFGTLAGPRLVPLSPGATGWARFAEATATMAYHEFACLIGAVAVTAMVWGGANMVALWTYLILWGMHVSGKLNVFFGVPNLSEEFIPSHLAYLTSYMRKRPMNLLFPITVTAASLLTAWLVWIAVGGAAGTFETTSALFLATLSALAVLEHWLLVLPLAPMALWNWSLSSRTPDLRVEAGRTTTHFRTPVLETGPRPD